MTRRIVVTGGGSGIGRSIASRFGTLGDEIVLIGRNESQLEIATSEIRSIGAVSASWIACDITNPTDVDRLGSDLSCNPIDVLINCAGARSDEPSRCASSSEVRNHALGVALPNLIGHYMVIHACLSLIRSPGGRIITISSMAAFRRSTPMYAASKAGIHGLTYSLATDLGPAGITVNAIAPGFIPDTPMFEGRLTDARREETIHDTPMRIAGRREHVAAAAVFLASAEAAYITGEVLQVSGGLVFGR